MSKINTLDYLNKAWAPVETLTEKRWVKELKNKGYYEEGIRY